MENEKKEKNLSLRGLNKKVEEFIDETRETNRQVLELLKAQSEPSVLSVTDGDISVDTNKGTVTVTPTVTPTVTTSKQIHHTETLEYQPKQMLQQEYQRIFEEYFDINDGFEAEMDFSDKITFTVMVPQKFSNATSAHWDFYKSDKRMVALPQGNISGGIQDWCDKVCKNIHYNKNDVKK